MEGPTIISPPRRRASPLGEENMRVLLRKTSLNASKGGDGIFSCAGSVPTTPAGWPDVLRTTLKKSPPPLIVNPRPPAYGRRPVRCPYPGNPGRLPEGRRPSRWSPPEAPAASLRQKAPRIIPQHLGRHPGHPEAIIPTQGSPPPPRADCLRQTALPEGRSPTSPAERILAEQSRLCSLCRISPQVQEP